MSMDVKVTLRFKDATAKVKQATAAGLFQEAEHIMNLSKREVPVDMGTLRNSGFVEMPRGDRSFINRSSHVIEVRMGYGGAASGYALYLHEGTGPAVGRPAFFPPIDVIKEWALRVLGATKDEDSRAFLLARSIGRKGLRPRKYLENPFRARAAGLQGRLAAFVQKALAGGR